MAYLSHFVLLLLGNGVLCNSSDRVELNGNAIHDNKDTGVHVKQGSHVTVRDNSITSNSGCGVFTSPESKVCIIYSILAYIEIN